MGFLREVSASVQARQGSAFRRRGFGAGRRFAFQRNQQTSYTLLFRRFVGRPIEEPRPGLHV